MAGITRIDIDPIVPGDRVTATITVWVALDIAAQSKDAQ